MKIFKQIIIVMGILSFFGCNSKANKNIDLDRMSAKIAYSSLTNEVKNKLRSELNHDNKKEFNEEWERTTILKNDIINKYGFEAIKLIFEYRNSQNYYNIGTFPNDCPWAVLNHLSIQECIEKNFGPLKSKLPLLVIALKERCKFIYAEKKENIWYLHYFLEMKLHDNRSFYKVYSGGAPLLDPKPNKNLQEYNWNVPSDLKLFYSVHNGFGEIYDAYYIMSNENIKVMAEMMDPICKEQNVSPKGYSFSDLLEFFPDGGGNAQCFFRVNGVTNSTVDWDHEVWEIQWEMDFFEFINERMSGIDEE